jgi:hypothetical protein
MSVHSPNRTPGVLLAGVLSLLCLAPIASAASPNVGAPKTGISATLEQCVSEGEQTERSATFAGEMATIPGSARMEMRIDVIERMPGEITYHTVSAPGLGVWRWSAPGVKAYRYLKQVTNLAGPAFYRGVVRYRWLSGRGRLLAVSVLRTKRCEQPATEALMPASATAQAAQPSA